MTRRRRDVEHERAADVAAEAIPPVHGQEHWRKCALALEERYAAVCVAAANAARSVGGTTTPAGLLVVTRILDAFELNEERYARRERALRLLGAFAVECGPAVEEYLARTETPKWLRDVLLVVLSRMRELAQTENGELT